MTFNKRRLSDVLSIIGSTILATFLIGATLFFFPANESQKIRVANDAKQVSNPEPHQTITWPRLAELLKSIKTRSLNDGFTNGFEYAPYAGSIVAIIGAGLVKGFMMPHKETFAAKIDDTPVYTCAVPIAQGSRHLAYNGWAREEFQPNKLAGLPFFDLQPVFIEKYARSYA